MSVEKQMKKKVRALQKVFNDDDFILRAVQGMGGIGSKVDFRYVFGNIFSYYFASEDLNHYYTIDEMNEKLWALQEKGSCVDQRYYFQAYNGCCEETYRKNGIDDVSDLSSEIKDAMEILESELGKTTQTTAGGEEKIRRSYITTDFEMLMRYAFDYSPERLWYGPLKDSEKTSIRVGESKSDYMMRVIEGKLEGKTEEEKDRIRGAGRIIADAYGTKRPRIAIIPESEIKDFKADFDSDTPNSEKEKPKITLYEIAEEENYGWTSGFQSGPNFSFEGGVVVYDKITPDKFVTVSVPDSYELLQMYAVQRGANFGDMINPVNGRIIERSKEQALDVQKPQNIFSKFVSRFKPAKKQIDMELSGEAQMQKHYEDMRKNLFGWNWRNASL